MEFVVIELPSSDFAIISAAEWFAEVGSSYLSLTHSLTHSSQLSTAFQEYYFKHSALGTEALVCKHLG